MFKMLVKYLFLFSVVSIFININTIFCHQNANQCNTLLSPIFARCTSREGELLDFKQDELNRVDTLNMSHLSTNDSMTCFNKAICRRIFKVAHISTQSFAAKTLVQISYMLDQCCGSCARYYLSKIPVENYLTNQSVFGNYDIIYPVLGQAGLSTVSNYSFIPVFQVPGAFYLTIGKTKKEMSMDMIQSCLNMWPIFVICLIISSIAGFIGWIAECRKNKGEFPSNFFLGMYEGFWWSFISMTTVGYGDRVPKTVFGRIFSIIWILIGVTIVGIFTASLTTEIMKSTSPTKPAKVNGKTVAILKGRLQDAIMVAQHGGIAVETEFNNTVHGIHHMIKRLVAKEVNGILLSRSTYFYFSRSIKDIDKYNEIFVDVNKINLVREEKDYKDFHPLVGLLVKNKKDYNFFKSYFEANWYYMQTCYLYSLNFKDKALVKIEDNILETVFQPFFHWTIGILGIILFFGSVYEIAKFFIKNPVKPADTGCPRT